MPLDFNKLTNEQIDLIISRLLKKFDDNTICIEDFSKVIVAYRKKRYDSGIIKILEGDEILKGKFYYMGQITPKEKKLLENKNISENANKLIEKDNDFVNIENDNSKNISILEENNTFSLRDNISSLNKLRTSSNRFDRNSSETTKNDILLEDNIKQIESRFSLSEINSQLPSETLLDRYQFGYVNLEDFDEGLDKKTLFNDRPQIKKDKRRK